MNSKLKTLEIALSEALHFSYDSCSFESEQQAEAFRADAKQLMIDIAKLRQIVDDGHVAHYEENNVRSLLAAADRTIDFAAEHDDVKHFVIAFDDAATVFIGGAPQVEALYAFIEHLSGENMYDDIDHMRAANKQ